MASPSALPPSGTGESRFARGWASIKKGLKWTRNVLFTTILLILKLILIALDMIGVVWIVNKISFGAVWIFRLITAGIKKCASLIKGRKVGFQNPLNPPANSSVQTARVKTPGRVMKYIVFACGILALLGIFLGTELKNGTVSLGINWGVILKAILGIATLGIIYKLRKKFKMNFGIDFGKVAIPLGRMFLFNFALWAGMKQFGDPKYFMNTYLWSASFFILNLMVLAIFFDHFSKTKIKAFMPYNAVVAIITITCFIKGVMPGFTGDKSIFGSLFNSSASASQYAGPEPVAQAIESVRRTDGHLSDRFPLSAEVDSLIDAVFANHTDSLRKVMKDIAVAESEGEQFEDGTTDVVKKGDVNERDLGLFQINDSLHGSTCTNSGFDIKELDGNARCAELLLTRRGTTNDWCASAWRWRDGYESKPQYWTCDRTPDQLLAGTDPRSSVHGDELLVADAPADSSWSQPVYSYGRSMKWSAPPGIDIEIQTPDGTIREQLAGQNLPNIPNSRYVKFRVKVGTGSEFSPITIIRSGN